MPFLPIKGVMIYNQIEPLSNEDRRVAGLMRSTHDTRRRLIALLFGAVFLAGWIDLVVVLLASPPFPSRALRCAIFGITLVSWVVCRRTVRRARAIEKLRDAVFKGEHRLNYVVPLDYSYQVLFTPAMCKAMQDPKRGLFIRERVDALLRNGLSITYDRWVHEESLLVADVGRRFEGKVGLIDMIEKLSDGLGIDQREHFTALRTAAHKKLQQELDEALIRHEEESAALAGLHLLR